MHGWELTDIRVVHGAEQQRVRMALQGPCVHCSFAWYASVHSGGCSALQAVLLRPHRFSRGADGIRETFFANAAVPA